MNRQQQNNLLKGVVKRVGITILCCVPVLVVIGYWLRNLNSVATMAIYVLVMFVALCFEEYIHLKISAKKQFKNTVLHKNEDVFK